MHTIPNFRRLVFRSASLALAGALLWGAAPAEEEPGEPRGEEEAGIALVITIDDAIGVATAEYFTDSLRAAQERKAKILVMELDTPGGLLEVTRDMIQEILASEVPVAVYVTPNGARAASAGTFILYASHVAAMSEATTLGAATPVSLGQSGSGAPPPSGVLGLSVAAASADEEAPEEIDGGAGGGQERDGPDEGPPDTSGDGGAGEKSPDADDGADSAEPPGKTSEEMDAEAMKRKIVNDAVSQIRTLARLRGRNADWAEEAVREGATLEAVEAVEMNVADFIARNIPDLLEKAHGLEVDANGEQIVLETAGLVVERLEPGWRTRLLSIITNPSVAYLLVLVGLYGLLLEGYNPGTWIPGVVGVISLLLAAYALNLLPVNYAGLALMVLGVGLIIAETFSPSLGILGIGGVVAFVVGSIILFDTGVPGFEAPLRVIGGVGLAAALAMLGLVVLLARSRKRPVVSGSESLMGSRAVALEDFDAAGPVMVQGERWQARTPLPACKGDELFVHSVDGLRLEVAPTPPALPPRPNLFALLKKLG